jgi:hypothetical protein
MLRAMTDGPDSTENAPLHILDLAASCVRFVERAVGLPPDLTPDTLPLLDHYLHTVRAAPHDEVAGLIVPAAGAYFGELVRRQLGPARWHWDAEDPSACRLEFQHCFLSFNPLGSVLEAIQGGAVEGSGAHFSLLRDQEALVQESLARMGDIREDDFYRLAVRFEALEQIVSLLIENAAADGNEPRTFGPELYAALRTGSGAGVLH